MTGIGADGVLLRREIGEQPAVLAETVTRLMEPAREAASAMRVSSPSRSLPAR